MGVRVKENKPAFKRKRDNYARKVRRKKLINYLVNQLRSCTTHGLPYIVNTEIHWFERFFWAVSFVFTIWVIFMLLSTQYLRYMNRPIVTSVEMDYFNWNVSFPAVTLCPSNKIEEYDLSSVINDTIEITGESQETLLRAITSLSLDTIEMYNFGAINISEALSPTDHAYLASMIFKKFDNNTITTSTNWPVSVEMSMTEYGLCHVINSNVAAFDNPTKWTIDLQYKTIKNSIQLSVHEQDFFIQLTNYADSYKVFIHSPDEIILRTTPSYSASKNTYITFGVQVLSTRISNSLRSTPLSLRKCRFIDEPISERYPIYSYNHCILECRIKMINKLCNCIPHIYRPLLDEQVCSVSELNCFVQYIEEILKLTVSKKTLNNLTNTDDLPRSPRDCGCLNSCESDVYRKDHESTEESDSNMLRISISSYPKVRIVHDTIFDIHDVILRSGGVINLCVGASMISFMELIVLGIKVALYLLSKAITSIFKKISHYFCRKLKTFNKNNK